MKPQRILISGAGIAGLTLAYWLKQFGHTPVVLEKAPGLRKGEYMIDFTGSGWDVAEWMGLIPSLRERAVPLSNITYRDEEGRIASKLPLPEVIALTGVEDRFVGLNRCDLEELLYEKVKDEVEIRFQTSIQSLQNQDGGVHVVFESGDEEDFDLVVGADGIHSNVRRLAFGPEDSFTDHMGYHVAAFRLPDMGDGIDTGFSMRVKPGRQASILNADNNDWLAYFFCVSDDTSYVPQKERQQRLKDTYSDMGWALTDCFDKLDDSVSVYYDTVTMIKMPQWYTGRVAVVGDAAYCLTPISGQGASMAMAGAFALAEAIAQQDSHEEAFAAYDGRLRSFVETLQAKAKKAAGSFIPRTQFQITKNTWAMRMFRWFSFLAPLLRPLVKQFSIKSVFQEEQKQGKEISGLLQSHLKPTA